MDDNDWPVIELCPIKQGILTTNFTQSASETVANVLVAELVERIDRPLSVQKVETFSSDQELEWVMQAINHALTLQFTPNQRYETLRSAVRIYLTWTTALTNFPHQTCPKPMLTHPDRYFRKILEALRPIFQQKCSQQNATQDSFLSLGRQGTQVRTVLGAIKQLLGSEALLEDYRDEVWSRALLFLYAIGEQLMAVGNCESPESIGFLMSGDICHCLFLCQLKAAIVELIPSPSYWRTLSALAWQCGAQIQFIEAWASSLLRTTAGLLQILYGQTAGNSTISFCDDDRAFEPFHTSSTFNPEKLRILKNLWQCLFVLIGNPAHFTQHAINLCERKIPNPSHMNFFVEECTLSFFLITFAFKKLLDIFLGDPFVSTDFNESEELHSLWLDSAGNAKMGATAGGVKNSQPERNNSNMSSVSNQPSPANNANSNGPVTFGLADDQPNSMTAVQMEGRIRGGQHVWYMLKNNPFKSDFRSFPAIRPSAVALLGLFLEWLFDAALFQPVHGAKEAVEQKDAGKSAEDALGPNHPKEKPSADTTAATAASSCTFANTTIAAASRIAGAGVEKKQQQHSQQPQLTGGAANSFGGGPGGHQVQQSQQQQTLPQPSQQKELVTALRRSFATSESGSNSSTTNNQIEPSIAGTMVDHSHPTPSSAHSSPTEFPSVEGIPSGRATAISALCRIVCAKSSRESFTDEQLARFFAILHEALLTRDRLILCSLIFYSCDNLFKLGLKGVQILLPNYLMAIDIVYTESIRLPLHPSITQSEMRAACLRAFASILSWPSVFGQTFILGQKSPLSGKPKRIARQGSSNNLLEPELRYTDLRPQMQRLLVFALRNETDPTNIQHALALAAMFCAESARFDLEMDGRKEEGNLANSSMQNGEKKDDKSVENNAEKKPNFSISLVRAVISAICDNICKQTWSKDVTCCLAAFDCLNSLSSIRHEILFFNGELSTGSLIITSLCRFIDQQLQKPPPHHSRDMHSTVVTAYFCMGVWLESAPALSNIESCLSTVANTIELGMTGGHGLAPEQYKPASQRVHDAAEALLQSLFSHANNKTSSNAKTELNECILAEKYGLELDKFQHFLLNQSTLLSLHEAQHIEQLSKGLPTVIAIFRTPFNHSWASLIQLMPRAKSRKILSEKNVVKIGENVMTAADQQSPSCLSVTSQAQTVDSCAVQSDGEQQKPKGQENANPTGVVNGTNGKQEQFEIPPEVFQPKCKLDLQFPKLEPAPPQVQNIQVQLAQIRARLSQGSGAPIGDRDSRNIWLNTSLGAMLSQPPTPESPVARCNSLRVFLHDMGFVNRQAYGKQFTPLDSSSYDIFYDSLAQTVDTHSVHLNEAVSLFYVKEGQRAVEDILQNNINLRQTSAQFCRFLSQLGKAVETRSFDTKGEPKNPTTNGHKDNTGTTTTNFVLDGVDHCLRWRDSQVELTFITPTGRTLVNGGGGGNFPPTLLLMNPSRKQSVLDQQYLVRNKSKTAEANNIKSQQLSTNTTNTEKSQHEKPDEALENAKSMVSILKELHRKRALLIWAQSVEEIHEMDDELESTWGPQQPKLRVKTVKMLPSSEDTAPASILAQLSSTAPTSGGQTASTTAPISALTTFPSLTPNSPCTAQTSGGQIALTTAPISASTTFSTLASNLPSTPLTSDDQIVSSTAPISGCQISSSTAPTSALTTFPTLTSNLQCTAPTFGGQIASTTAPTSPTTFPTSLTFEEAADVPTCTTTILTLPTTLDAQSASSELPAISMMTATNVVVKSARFSPRRRPFAGGTSQQVSTETSIDNDTGIPKRSEETGLESKEMEIDVKCSFDALSIVPPQRRASRHLLERLDIPPTILDENNASEQYQQQLQQQQEMLSPPMSPGFNGRGRRRSSIFRELLGTSSKRRESKQGDELAKELAMERKESLACSETSQASNSSKGRAPLQLQERTNSVTTISYLKSFFRRTSKVVAATNSASSTALSGEVTPKAERRKSRATLFGFGEICEDVGAEYGANSPLPVEEAGGAVSGTKPTGGFSPRESFASSTTASTNFKHQNVEHNGEKSPLVSDLDQFQSIKSGRTMSCASANESVSNAEHSAGRYAKRSPDMRIFVVWLERLEDMHTFPLADMFPFTAKTLQHTTAGTTQMKCPSPLQIDHLCFFLCPVERGLVRVQVDGVWTKYGQPGPLLNGSVVSAKELPALLRHTVASVARRKAVEIENYQMTHLRRKQAITEFGRRFGTRMDYTDFVEQLLGTDAAS